MRRLIAICYFGVGLLQAWTMSVEFPYTALPRLVWERELAHLKELGVAHISLPQPENSAQLDDVIHIIRRLGLEADLEGPLPDRLQTLTKSHGGPLTEALPGAVRISAIMPRALDNERKLITSGTTAIIWTNGFETLSPGYHPGAIALSGTESAGAALLRREAQLERFWGKEFSGLPEMAGARLALPLDSVSIHQYVADKNTASPAGLSLVSIVNDSPDAWKGEARVLYPALQRPIGLPAVSVGARDVLWLPVNVPLAAGPMCSGCTGFAPSDHLAYATAELTGMEYENGILAMEFIASAAGEAVLQLSHEPVGPLVAGGRPSVFDWDPKTQRARLTIPAGNARTGRVRVALAIDAPAATGFFDGPSVLLIGETNRLTAQFSPPDVASRSRLRTASELTVVQEVPAPQEPAASEQKSEIEKAMEAAIKAQEKKNEPALITYKVSVPASAIPGDTAQLAIEADGMQLSHSQLHILPAATITFEDAVAVRLTADSMIAISPATIPVNQKPGREIVISLRNNSPEIRTFNIAIRVPGLEFSPETLNVSVGASIARDVTFRVFSASAAPGVHEGELKLSGATALTEPVRFVVLPAVGEIAWSAEGFSMLENAKLRATFLADRWLEMIDKSSGSDSQPAGGTVFTGGPIVALKMQELEKIQTTH